MRSAIILVIWMVLVAGLVHIIFDAESGLFFSGPMAAIGLTLLGAGMCVHGHRSRRSVEVKEKE